MAECGLGLDREALRRGARRVCSSNFCGESKKACIVETNLVKEYLLRAKLVRQRLTGRGWGICSETV